MKAHNFASRRARFFRTKTDPQNSQEPHQINVSKKPTSKMIDGNSLPYYQDRRKRGFHPLFRVPSALSISPVFQRKNKGGGQALPPRIAFGNPHPPTRRVGVFYCVR